MCCAYCIRHPLAVCKVGMLAYQMCGHVDASPQVPALSLRYITIPV